MPGGSEAQPPESPVVVTVRVQPGARRDGIVGRYGDLPKIAVRAPAVDGRANEAVCEVLASVLGVRSRQIRLVSGARSRTKRFEITGISPAAASELLG